MKTLMRKLIAAKAHRYGTRQIKAGDEYEASRLHSRILVGARLARYAEEQPERPPVLARASQQETAPPPPAPPPPASPQAASPLPHGSTGAEGTATADPETSPANQEELAQLRHKAASLGVLVDARWGINRLNREILQRTGSQERPGTRR